MNEISYTFATRPSSARFSLEVAERAISVSVGEPIMSPEEMKIALVALTNVATDLLEMNRVLHAELTKPKKTLFQKIFRK